MRVSRMPAMNVRMSVPLAAAFFAIVRLLSHLRYCTCPSRMAASFLCAIGQPLLRSLTLCLRESIDAPPRR
jgi:hypothetical protein